MTPETKLSFLTAIEKQHGRQLRRFLMARMRNAAADAADLAQEVFLRLLRIPDHESIRNPRAYLYTIASHVLHQHTLKQTATPESIEIGDVVSELEAAPEDDPELQAQLDQRFEQLRRELRAISPGVYATLILHRYYGLPLTDISRRLGVSYSMTKKYLAKGLQYLERRLEEGKEVP